MATRVHPHSGRLDAPALVELLGELLGPDEQLEAHVIGIEPVAEQLRLHMAPLPPDERCAAAGLFGMRARPTWCAVALTLVGRARHMDTAEVVGQATAMVVVDRQGLVASTLQVDRGPLDAAPLEDSALEDSALEDGALDPAPNPGPPEGLTVDALHRMLGLPAPGHAPPTPLFILALWSQLLIDHTFECGATTWTDAVRLHPGEPGRGRVAASVETVVEATLQTDGLINWQRMHRRGCAGAGPRDLSRSEAKWMDPTMYARWALGSLPDPHLAVQILSAHGCDHAAAGLDTVRHAVLAEVSGRRAPESEPDANGV